MMELPEYPHARPVSLDARPLFMKAYRHSPPSTAELLFNSIFGWQEQFNYQLSRCGDLLLVFYRQERRTVFLPPLLLAGGVCDPGWVPLFGEAARCIVQHCRISGTEAVFHAFPDYYARCLVPGCFTALPERDSFEYIYRKDALVDLTGQKYGPKRNLIRQFTRKYAHRYEPLHRDNRDTIRRFIERWRPAGGQAGDVASGEYRMVMRLMDHFDELQPCGGILFADDKEVAVTVATVAPDFAYVDGCAATAVVHSEHALTEYKGASQMINQLFCAHLPAPVIYVNREEDMGIPGLRKAKLSYAPERLLTKSALSLITETAGSGGQHAPCETGTRCTQVVL